MIRLIAGLWFCVATFAPSFAALAAPIVVPPSLPAGTPYRLVFASDTAETALSTDITDYNAYVTSAANSNGTLASLGTTWKAIVSTATVDARDNTETNPTMALGVPIYNLAGQLIATSNADLWDGNILAPILYDQDGDLYPPGNQIVWTGTQPAGISDEPLGTTLPSWGQGNFATRDWVFSSYGTYTSDRLFLFYGMSGLLTAVPEPSSCALAIISAFTVAAIGFRRFR